MRHLPKLFATFFLIIGALFSYVREVEIPCRIAFNDLSESTVSWATTWNVAEDLAYMLDNGLKNSSNAALTTLSPENVQIDLLEYRTMPANCEPKTALFPADTQWCQNLLRIKVRLKVFCRPGALIYNEVITSDHLLDSDGVHYDYCRHTNTSPRYPMTPLAHAHGDFIRDVIARLERLQMKGIL